METPAPKAAPESAQTPTQSATQQQPAQSAATPVRPAAAPAPTPQPEDAHSSATRRGKGSDSSAKTSEIAVPNSISSPASISTPAPASAPAFVSGFRLSPYYGESVLEYVFDPGIKIHLNIPALTGANKPAVQPPARLIIYALPNGNTTPQTIGCKARKDISWRYDIQQIGAQTRALREAFSGAETLETAYLEAEGRSWPGWRKKHEADAPARIRAAIENLRQRAAIAAVPGALTAGGVIPDVLPPVALTAHSGGGAFIFSFIDSGEKIPAWVERIVFLDANYGFDDAKGHAAKLAAWLRENPGARLPLLAYDDRAIKLDGKPVLKNPLNGTYGSTQRMVEALKKYFPIEESKDGDWTLYRGLDGRLDFRVHANPRNEILHTVLVGEMNGFLWAAAHGTPAGAKFAKPGKPRAYTQWVQSDPETTPSLSVKRP